MYEWFVNCKTVFKLVLEESNCLESLTWVSMMIGANLHHLLIQKNLFNIFFMS